MIPRCGKIVEADTTHVGGKERNKHESKRDGGKIGGMGKQIVHTLVERNGAARSHHIPNVTGKRCVPSYSRRRAASQR